MDFLEKKIKTCLKILRIIRTIKFDKVVRENELFKTI